MVDLNGVGVFIAVAETKNFRLAAERLGVTRPAVSQALRRLEDRLGSALLHRTTRSVRLTEAGQRLYETVAPAVTEVTNALATAADRHVRPSGRLRLAVSSIAEEFLAGPAFVAFMDACPDVYLDVTVTDDEFDIVAEGYDAGVRLGEVIQKDMVAVPVSRPQSQRVVGTAAYLKRHGTPLHPRELNGHRCIGWRPRPDAAPYRWEFTDGGRDFDVAVEPRATTNDMEMMVKLALAGGGLTFGLEETFRPHLERGDLVSVLEEYLPPFPGFFLYYPARRNLSPKMRAFVDGIKAARLGGADA